MVRVFQAEAAADLRAARGLMREYGAFISSKLGAEHVCKASLEEEIVDAAKIYAAPRGFLLLACCGGLPEPCGCLALRPLPSRPAEAAEIKRLWVRPECRGHEAGAALLDRALELAGELGYARVVLDTVPAAMPAAVKLYLSRDFNPTTRFNDNSIPGIVFYCRDLSPRGTP